RHTAPATGRRDWARPRRRRWRSGRESPLRGSRGWRRGGPSSPRSEGGAGIRARGLGKAGAGREADRDELVGLAREHRAEDLAGIAELRERAGEGIDVGGGERAVVGLGRQDARIAAL